MNPTIRPALSGDVEEAVPLIYSSGPAAFDYVFGYEKEPSATAFLSSSFARGPGQFGFENHIVADVEGVAVGIAAGYGTETNLPFIFSSARQIFGFYPVGAAAGVAIRGLKLERVIKPPARGELYVAHVGVTPEMRSKGIGTLLMDALIDRARTEGRAALSLDVSVENPRAEDLYRRLGFEVTEELEGKLVSPFGSVINHLRMVLPL